MMTLMACARKNAARPSNPPGVDADVVVLGIDPGLQRTGYAFLAAGRSAGNLRVAEAGVIRLNPRDSLEQRLFELGSELDSLIMAHRPAVMACEQLYAHYKHPRTAILMGHARGVILAGAARHGLAVQGVAATEVKRHLTGNGHASKAQVQRAIAATLGLPQIPEPNDVADALAIAFCGVQLVSGRGEAARVGGEGRA